MDELQVLRDLIEIDGGPSDSVLSRAQRELEVAFHLDTGPPKTGRRIATTSADADHRRAFRRRGRWTVLVATAAALIALLAAYLPTSSSDLKFSGELGLQVSSASTVSPAPLTRAIDDSMTIGYVPGGFNLLTATRTNSEIAPESDSESLIYGKTEHDGRHLLMVNWGPSDYTGSDGPPMEPGTIRSLIIRGNPGYLVILPQSGGIGDGRRGSGQTSSVPLAAPGLPQYFYTWSEGGIGYQVEGDGLPMNEVLRVIAGLTYHPSVWSCWTLSPPRKNGTCAPGTVNSPTVEVAVVGSVVATGTVNGQPWTFTATLDAKANPSTNLPAGWSSDHLYYAGGTGGGDGWAKSRDPRLVARTIAIDVDSEYDGQRFAFGVVPKTITSVSVRSVQFGTTIREPVLPMQIKNSAFFVLSLGRVGGLCDHLCTGPVSVTLHTQTKAVSRITMGCSGGDSVGTYLGFRQSGAGGCAGLVAPVASGSQPTASQPLFGSCSMFADSGRPAAPLLGAFVEVTSGVVADRHWSLWAEKGLTGVSSVGQGVFVFGGRWYAMCMSPSGRDSGGLFKASVAFSFSLIDALPGGVIYGYVGAPDVETLQLNEQLRNYALGEALPITSSQHIRGATFFVASLPQSACDFPAIALTATTSLVRLRQGSIYRTCRPGELVQITSSGGVEGLINPHPNIGASR
jgi:hypothetical protein